MITVMQVAVQPDAFEKEWILARYISFISLCCGKLIFKYVAVSVIAYHKDTGFYDVCDVDDDGMYSLPESQVFLFDYFYWE